MPLHLTPSWSHRTAVGALTVVAITGISACGSGAPAGSPASQSKAAAPSAAVKHLPASEFTTALKKPGTIVLDVRTPAEYASGHLPKAQNIDIKGADFATKIAALDKKATYAVYCQSGKRSSAALEQMTAAGYTQVYDLAGGIIAWRTMGGPMATGNS